MKTKILTALFISLFAMVGCEKQDSSVSRGPIQLTANQQQIVDSTNTFGLNIFKEVVTNSDENANVFISPLSISMALSMLYNGTANATREELKDVLGYSGMTPDYKGFIRNQNLLNLWI
jgi:serine protease inhibitor